MNRGLFFVALSSLGAVLLSSPAAIGGEPAPDADAEVVVVADTERLSVLAEALKDGQSARGQLQTAVFDWTSEGLDIHLGQSRAGVVVAEGGPFSLGVFTALRRHSGRRGLQVLEDYLEGTAATLDRLSVAGSVFLRVELPLEPKKRRRKPSLLERAAEGLSVQCAEVSDCVLVLVPVASEVEASFHQLVGGRLEWVEVVPVVSPWDSDGALLEPTVLSQERLFIRRSSARQKEVRFWAFLPQPEEPGQRYPVLYLLHGATGDYRDWRTHAQVQLLNLASRYGVVIITPDGDPHGWYLDSPVESASAMESYFFDELIPYVEEGAGLPVASGPDHRAIAGLSMGGHGALSLALRRSGSFRAASSMSGILDITSHPRSWQIADRLGPLEEHRPGWEEHSVAHLLRSGAGKDLPILFVCGDADRAAWTENLALHQELTAAGREHEWRSSTEGHSWGYWTAELPLHVAFAAEYLRGDGVRTVPGDGPPNEEDDSASLGSED